MKRLNAIAALIVPLVLPGSLLAQSDDPLADPGHFDVFIGVAGSPATGGRLIADVEGRFPIDAETRAPIVSTTLEVDTFRGQTFATYETDQPGWQILSGNIAPGETLRFRALGRLRYYDPATESWDHGVPNGERVTFFGAVPPEIAIGGDTDLIAPYLEGTKWTVEGLVGVEESAIEVASGSGAIHSHLDFCVEDRTGDCTRVSAPTPGTPATGAYLVQMEFWMDEQLDGEQKYVDSNPLLVAINNGMPVADFQAAVRKRVAPASDGDGVTPPPAGTAVLILSTQ